MTAQDKQPKPGKRDDVQGEGDYRSAREFNEKERAFVRSHDTEELGEEAKPDTPGQAADLERAEEQGKARARPDPEVNAPDIERDRDGATEGVTPPKR